VVLLKKRGVPLRVDQCFAQLFDLIIN
jgi:hypothetical protein